MKPDYTVNPSEAKIHRPKTFAIGIAIMAIGIFLMVFEHLWEPAVNQYLRGIEAGRAVAGIVRSLDLLVLFVGVYFTLKGRQRPFNDIEKQRLSDQ